MNTEAFKSVGYLLLSNDLQPALYSIDRRERRKKKQQFLPSFF